MRAFPFSIVSLCPWLATAVVLLACLSRAQAVSENGFARGNQLYAVGKYAEAAAAYETQVRHGEDSANLFYNLGDAYHRIGNRGRAILNFRRALWLEPSHAEAAANLVFAGGNLPAASGLAAPGVKILSWLTAAAGWWTVAAALAAVFRRRWRTAAATLAAAGLLATASGVVALWWTEDANRSAALALVVAENVPALYSPADNSKTVTTLPAGAEVRVLSVQGAWTYALLGNGTRAWISSGQVERLVPIMGR